MIHSCDRGSAVVEFVGVGALVTLAALGVMQVGMVSHVKAVVTDSAIAGAAYAALADSSLAAGIERTRELAAMGIARDLITDVTATTTTVAGKPVVVITASYRVPTLGPWAPMAVSSTSGRAFLETR